MIKSLLSIFVTYRISRDYFYLLSVTLLFFVAGAVYTLAILDEKTSGYDFYQLFVNDKDLGMCGYQLWDSMGYMNVSKQKNLTEILDDRAATINEGDSYISILRVAFTPILSLSVSILTPLVLGNPFNWLQQHSVPVCQDHLSLKTCYHQHLDKAVVFYQDLH